MEVWDPTDFTEKFTDGTFDGQLFEQLDKLTEKQLDEILQALTCIQQN